MSRFETWENHESNLPKICHSPKSVILERSAAKSKDLQLLLSLPFLRSAQIQGCPMSRF